jgi:transposase-like protein
MSRHDYRRKPPFCPNPDCNSHAHPSTWRYKKKGFFERKASPQRIQRYVCRSCGRNFSSQTFSPTYWLRRPELLRSIFYRSLACIMFAMPERERLNRSGIAGHSIC